LISAGALPQNPLGELTALPRPPSWIGPILLRGGRGKGREGNGGGERGKRRGERKGVLDLSLKYMVTLPMLKLKTGSIKHRV